MGDLSKYLLLLVSLAMMSPLFSQPGPIPKNTRDTITIHPGWPKSMDGKNERGGIYCNLDLDPDLEIVYNIGDYVYALNMNGTAVDGWPVKLNYPTDGAPAFGDIDGDGHGELVVTTHQPTSYNDGKIYAFERNGTNVFGFPVTTLGGPLRSPVLADLDQDGSMEIIVAVRKWPEGFIHAYRGNGTMFSGWPVRMDYIPASAVAAGDITGDEFPEVIAESYYSLHAYNADGSLLPGFPFTPGNDRVFSYSSPVLADIDENGYREIIFGDHSTTSGDGNLYVLQNDGTHFPNWPKTTSSGIYCPPAVGDLNQDGTLDIVTGEYGFNFNVYKLYAWNGLTGNFLPGFPVLGLNSINNQVIMADLDGDGEIEMMFDDNTSAGVYPGYNHDGTPMEGWPLHVNGTSFYINPFVADLNGDGILEISGGGYDPNEDKTYLFLWDTQVEMNEDLALLPVLQYNTRHNGVVGDFLMVDTPEYLPSENHQDKIHITPNPARSNVTIHSENLNSNHATLELIDLGGRVIKTFRIGPEHGHEQGFTVDVSGCVPGTYLLQLKTDHQTISEKLVIVP